MSDKLASNQRPTMNFMVDGQALGSISRGVRPPSREHATVTWLKDGWKMGRLRMNWFSWLIQEFQAKQGHIKIAEHVCFFAVIKHVFVWSIFGAYFHCEVWSREFTIVNSLYTWFWHVPICFIYPFPWPFVVNGWSWPCSTPLFHRGLEGLLPVHVTLNREFPFKTVLKSRKGCVSLPKNWWTNCFSYLLGICGKFQQMWQEWDIMWHCETQLFLWGRGTS